MLPNHKTETQIVYFTNSGSPVTGLNPTFVHYKDVTDPSSPVDIMPQPSIFELGNGLYGFLPEATADKIYSYEIDGGPIISENGERYIAGIISWGEYPNFDDSSIISQIEVNRNLINELLDIEEGNWLIQNNQMIFYKRNGDELMRFNLFDSSDSPSESEVYRRDKV